MVNLPVSKTIHFLVSTVLSHEVDMVLRKKETKILKKGGNLK